MVIASLLTSRSRLYIDEFDTKDRISKSHSDTSPIYFYDRGKPFSSAPILHIVVLTSSREVFLCLCFVFRSRNISLYSTEYDEKIYAISEHRA